MIKVSKGIIDTWLIDTYIIVLWDKEVDVWHQRVAEKSEKEIFMAAELNHSPYDVVYLQEDSELADQQKYPVIIYPQPGLFQELTGSNVRDFTFESKFEEPVWAQVLSDEAVKIKMPLFNDIIESLDGTRILAEYGNSYRFKRTICRYNRCT